MMDHSQILEVCVAFSLSPLIRRSDRTCSDATIPPVARYCLMFLLNNELGCNSGVFKKSRE